MKITLSEPELMMAGIIGVMRQVASIKRQLQDAHGCRRDNGWTLHIQGACGELAAAKALRLPWTGTVNTFKSQGDLGDIEVRSRAEHDYDLLLRKGDNPNRIYVLVRGIPPELDVVGWLYGREAMKDEYLQAYANREPAYFCPAENLQPIESLALLLKYGD